MGRRLPANLVVLCEAFGIDPDSEQLPNLMVPESFEVDGIEFVCDYTPESTSERFFIVKPLRSVHEYRQLLATLPPQPRIMELGVAEGGSTALTALDVELGCLVAIDNEEQRLEALDQFLVERDLTDVVHVHWGVDQADASTLYSILDAHLEGEPLDLVVDDASHDLDLTRASFDILFPLLAPGGRYVIEDWANSHVFLDAVGKALRDPANADAIREQVARQSAATSPARLDEQRTLSRMAFDLVLTRASGGDVVASVCFEELGIVVTRGPAVLEPGSFRLLDQFIDHYKIHPDSR